MSIIIPDLDEPIIKFMDLPKMVQLMQTNIYYYEIIKKQILITEWIKMKYVSGTLEYAFIEACKNNYIEYAKSLIDRYDIKLKKDMTSDSSCGKKHVDRIRPHVYHRHTVSECAFTWACQYGNINIAKWLIKIAHDYDENKIKMAYINIPYENRANAFLALLEPCKINIHAQGENVFYRTCINAQFEIAKWLIELCEYEQNKIDIHVYQQLIFEDSCAKGQLYIAKWLIELGENHGYGKIDIRIQNESIFRRTCGNGHLEMAKWLIDLGENHEYGKIDIHANDEDAFRSSFVEIAKWLIDLGENHGYGKINIHASNEDTFIGRCEIGHLEMAKWLIDLGENHGYGKIDIHADNEDAFRGSCVNGHLEMAKWLIDLGENHGYGKIDIYIYLKCNANVFWIK